MTEIIIIKGKPHSFNNTEIVLDGGEQYIFGIKDLYDDKDKNTLTWKVYKADGGLLKEKTGKWSEKLLCSIDKKLCGDYRYELEAVVKQSDGTIVSTCKYAKDSTEQYKRNFML